MTDDAEKPQFRYFVRWVSPRDGTPYEHWYVKQHNAERFAAEMRQIGIEVTTGKKELQS